jgi:hypothetical protein
MMVFALQPIPSDRIPLINRLLALLRVWRLHTPGVGLEDGLPVVKFSNLRNLERGPGRITKSSFILAVHISESPI